MDNGIFIRLCKDIVEKEYNNTISKNNIYVVWSCKTLQNNKALLSTTVSDGAYFEMTYNGDKKELYVDKYVKEKNFVIK